jgi:prepilin-type N-terminal cleavage/methylation domain-containing protein
MNPNSERAFTLVETLVAITIILVMLVAPLQAVERAAGAAFAARDELIGTGLAQEGVEYVREIRANNYLVNVQNSNTAKSWLEGVDGTNSTPNCMAPALCTFDSTPGAQTPIAQCFDGINGHSTTCLTTPLYLNSSSLYSQQSSGVATKFYRTLQVQTISGTEVEVISTVQWNSNHTPYTTVTTDYLTNWL